MNPTGPTAPPTTPLHQRWQRFLAAALRAFHVYAGWLVSISWRRFIVLSLGLLIVMGIVHDMPPFTWTMTERIESPAPRVIVVPPPAVPRPPAAPQAVPTPSDGAGSAPQRPSIRIHKPGRGEPMEINIDKDGIRIGPGARRATGEAATAAESAAVAAVAASAAAAAAETAASAALKGLKITLPPGVASDAVREAIDDARRQIEASVAEARRDAEQAAGDAAEARREADRVVREVLGEQERPRPTTRTRRVGIGDAMMQLTLLFIVASAIIKFTYKGQQQAEVKAAIATETAEAESLKRQVVEARMAAMQAQVEPHFLFNTLASIDHLIETDPARASQMQKNLIALLRASMPTMREAAGQGGAGGVRDLGRELAVIRPYLEILKVRMEERLTTEIAVPEGLLSAEFPPMMLQTLVENAIKHGLEPKPEGGRLRLAAEIMHGKLQVSVADTGLGFGRAPTAGTGVGLANIRERLQLLYGPRAALTVAENPGGGTVVTVTVPYKSIEAAVA